MNRPVKRLKEQQTRSSRPPPLAPRRPADRSSRMSLAQLLILVGLALGVVCVFGALIGSLALNGNLLAGSPLPELVVSQATPSPPTPSTSPLPSAPSPGPATPAPSAAPSTYPSPNPPTPTATLVVPAGLVNQEKINEIIAYVTNIRDLQPRRDVPSVFLTRGQLRERLAAEYSQARISSALDRSRELYVAMDLLDPATDFEAVALDSAAQHVAGFYSPDEQVLYLVAESVNMFASEEVVYAHEYTHALQDQHFDLARLLGEGMSADQAIAARALVEGEATLVMGVYQFTEITESELEYMAYKASFVDREVIDGISPSLGVLTFFPYLQGSYLVYALWVDGGFGWDRVNAAYDDPPLSSEQVMHPEKYLVRDAPQAVTLPDLNPALGEGWREVERDVLGEIGLLAWLLDRLDGSAASEGAAGWDGDLYSLWSHPDGSQVLVVRSVWDAPGEAVQFFETYTDYLTRRGLGVPKLTLNEPGRRVWEYAGRATLLARAGDQVLIILAPDRAVLDRVKNLFPEF